MTSNLIVAEAPEEDVAFDAFNVGTGRPHAIVDFALGLAESLAPDIRPEFPGLFRLGDVRHIFANVSKIERLGFKPRVPLKREYQDSHKNLRYHRDRVFVTGHEVAVILPALNEAQAVEAVIEGFLREGHARYRCR